MNRWGIFVALSIAALAAAMVLASPRTADAAHDMGNDCYFCHSLRGGAVWDNTYAIAKSSAIGGTGMQGPVNCDFCHTDYGAKFIDSPGPVTSGHPVKTISGTSRVVQLPKLYPAGLEVDCHSCHRGDTRAGGKVPDLAPKWYGIGGEIGSGHPDHDLSGTLNNRVDPGDPPHLGTWEPGQPDNLVTRIYRKDPASAANVLSYYALCLTCHNSGGRTTGTDNIAKKYVDGGHYFKAAGSFDNSSWSAGARIPCSDCHASHASPTNKYNFEPEARTFSGTRPTGKTTNRAICLSCHDGLGGTQSSVTVRGVRPTSRTAGITEHLLSDTTPCKNCHDPHNPPAGGNDCLNCHRTGGPANARHQQADLEFPADGTWNAGAGEDNPSVQAHGHTGVVYSAVDNYATKATNECKKCHGTTHPTGLGKVTEADRARSYATGFVYGLSYSAPTWSANPASFADADGNGIIDGNDFCMSCHDGADALDAGGRTNIRIGGVDPPRVWFPAGGISTGHDRKSGTNYPVSGNPPAQQLCTSCHKYHVSDRQQLFPGNVGPYGAGSAYTYAMPSWAGIVTSWQAPRPATPSFPSTGGRMVIGNRNADAINYADRSSPLSGKGFGTAGSTKTTFDGLCDACHRDAATVTVNTLNQAHTHEGDNTAVGSRNIFVKDCLECHNPHGGGNRPTPNVFMIRETLGRDNTIQNAVFFTVKTGADSYDEKDSPVESNLDDVCATCHNSPPITHNFRTEAVAGTHNQGTNCITCHQHGATDNAAKLGFIPLQCNGCHTYPGLATNGAHRLSASSHDVHVGRPSDEPAIPNKGYACTQCHNGSSHNDAGILNSAQWASVNVDNHVQVRFDNTWNPLISNPADTTQDSTSYADSTNTCSNLYCHGAGLASAGSDTTPVWGNAGTAYCGSCHAPEHQPGPDLASGNHPVHLGTHTADNTIGPQGLMMHPVGTPGSWPPGELNRSCAACHPFDVASTVSCSNCHGGASGVLIVRSPTHVNRQVDFTNNDNTPNVTSTLGTTAPSADPPADSTDRCSNCHSTATVNGSAGAVLAKTNWDNNAYKLDCLTCHNGTDPGTNYFDGTGRTAPDMLGDDNTYGAEARGHNRPTSGPAPSGPYPVTGNPAANLSCTACHDASLRHLNNVNDNSYSGNRLQGSVNTVTGITTVSGLCGACHTRGALSSPATKKDVNTHGNTGFPGRLEPATFSATCDQCHEPHGMVNVTAAPAGVNIWMINPTIEVTAGVTRQPVRFFAKTGVNSFNDYDPGAGNDNNAALYNTNAADDLCATCHASPSNPGYQTRYNVAGRHNAPAFSGNETGKDCSGCHSHNQDGNIATVDGLMPLACNGCHTYPGLPTNGAHRISPQSHDRHVGVPSDVPAVANLGYSCSRCHNGSSHNDAGITGPAGWGSVNTDNHVQVRFDSFNPVAAANNPVDTTKDSTSYNDTTNVCSNLYCHGAPPTLPDWDVASTVTGCGVCHQNQGAGTGSYSGAHHSHSNPSAASDYLIACEACHADRAATHPNTSHVGGPDNATWAAKTAEVRFTDNASNQTYDNVAFTFRSKNLWVNPFTGGSATPTYTGAGSSAGTDSINPQITWTQGTCDTVWCHSNASPLGWKGTPGDNVYRTPVWTGNCIACHPGAVGRNCNVCHTYRSSAAAMDNSAENLSRAHVTHAATDRYAFTCDECHAWTVINDPPASPTVGTIIDGTGHDNHVNGVKTVRFGTTLRTTTINQSGGTYDNAAYRCYNTYCHSNGTDNTTFSTASQWPLDNTISWNSATGGTCRTCHGGNAASGAPISTGSHSKHIASYRCSACHRQTVAAASDNVIAAYDNHVNGRKNVAQGDGYTFSYAAGSCTSISCHGGNNATWGGPALSCSACHMAAADTDQYQTASDTWFSNDNTATLNSTEWTYSGHGKPAAQAYDVSGHAGADFPAGAGAGDPCYYCHDPGVGHRQAGNPFRLRDQTGVSGFGTAGWNATCLVCHRKTPAPPGYGSALGYANKVAAAGDRVDTAHYGSKHAPDNTSGGRFCWDCHDGHGDRLNGTTGSIYMIQSVAMRKSDGAFGYRGTAGLITSAVVFQNDNASTTGGDWADNTAPFNGICNVCHTTTNHYTSTSGDAHNRTVACITCHSHDDNFGAACNTCHGDVNRAVRNDGSAYPPDGPHTGVGGWTGVNWAEDIGTPSSLGDHVKHAGAPPNYGKDCAKCHIAGYGSDAAHATGKDNATMTAMSSFGTWSGGTLIGRTSVTDDSCATVTCHSPYSAENPSNVYMSGTPFSTGGNAYTRYWIDNVSWDCYTCHPYDGRTATTRPGGPGSGAINTGSHGIHVSAAFTGLGCTPCHASGGYTINHKGGTVDWSFAGAPNPYGSSPSTNVPSGTQAPTDDNTAGGHRAYTSCSNVYCHSTVQTSPPGGAPTYSTPRWGSPGTGGCGTCHASGWSAGHTGDTGPKIASGSHTRHVDGATYNVGCDICHVQSGCSQNCHFNAPGSHADGRVQVPMAKSWRAFAMTAASTIYDNTSGAPTVDDNVAAMGADASYGRCSAVLCHGDGRGGTPRIDPAIWGDNQVATTNCTYCHGGNTASGAPMATGSHANHIALYKCSACHRATLAANSDNTVVAYDNHVNGTRNVVQGDGHTFAYTTGAPFGSCSAISCHNGGSATWGGSAGCSSCHLGTGDVDDFGTGTAASIYNNGIGARIDNTQWMYSGHGKAAGTYDVSGHNAANFGRNANPDPCAYCHDSGVPHNTASNPFRLRDQTGVSGFGADGWNATCLVCHSKSSPVPPGYDPDNTAAAYVLINSTDNGSRVETAHYGSKHTAAKNGGIICWNCHDPHGDRTATGGNIFMIGKRVTRQSDNVLGIPAGGNDNSNRVVPVFTAAATGTDYAKSASPFDGICQVCHDGTVAHYTSTSGDGHNATVRCTSCHVHDADFAPVCTACHGGGLSGEGFQNWWPDSQAANGTRWPNRNGGATPHTRHVSRIAEVVNATATPTTAQKNATCDWCHPTGDHTGDQAAPPADLMDGSTYRFKNIAGATNLRTTTVTQGPGADNTWDDPPPSDDAVTCSNVDCHYTRTMGAADWYSPPPQSTCSYCHVPDNSSYAAGDLPNAHDNHVGVYNYICGWCHPIWGGTFDHQDGRVSLDWGYNPGPEAGDRFVSGGTGVPKFGGGTAGDYASCGGLTCHGDWDDPGIGFKGGNNWSPNWFNSTVQVGTDNSDGRCGTCHGDPSAAGTATNKAWPRSGVNSESHGEHIASNSKPTCSACHYDALGTNGTYGNPATHANRALTPIDIDNTFNYETANATFEGTGNTCANVRCHNGRITPNFALSGGANITCGACHNGGTGATDPRPSGDNVSRSHPAHSDNNAVYTDCDNCHGSAAYNVSGSRGGSAYTATGGGGASPNGIHQNLVVNLYINGGSGSYVDADNTAGGVNWNSAGATHVDDGTCSTTLCHGGGTPVWGGTLANGCFECHAGAESGSTKPSGAADNVPNPVVLTGQYDTYGHGRPTASGAYPGTGNPPANYLWNGATDNCYSCHAGTAQHSPQSSSSDPFRLGATFADNTDGLCDTCHGAGGTATKVNIEEHSKAITGSSKTWPGTNYPFKCVDCHDPHGDTNWGMVRSHISAPTTTGDTSFGSNSKGTPQDAANASAVTFTSVTGYAANSYGISGAENGICEVCHTQTGYYRRGEASAQTHNTSGRCTSCHAHEDGFKASCTDCHGNAATGQIWPDSTPGDQYMDRAGAHLKHVNAIAGSGATISQKNTVCDTCHPSPGGPRPGTGESAHSDNAAPVNIGDVHGDGRSGATATFFKTISGATDPDGAYNNTTKQCSNIDCHGGSMTPSWYYVADNAAPVWTPNSGIAATNPNLGGTLNVTWRRAVDAYPSNPVRYDLYMSTTNTSAAVFGSTPVYTGLLDNSATVTGLTNGTTYYFGVRAKDSWPIPNVTTNTDISAGVVPSGVGGGTTTTYVLRKDNGTGLWSGTTTNGNSCFSSWSVTPVITLTSPPNARGLLSATKACSNNTNNFVTPNTAYTGYRNLVGFYLPSTYAQTTRVTGSSTGNSFGVRGNSGNENVRVYLVAVINTSAGTHTLSANFAEYSNVPNTNPAEHWQPDMGNVSINVPAGSRLGLLFQFNDSGGFNSSNDRITLDAFDTTILNQVTLTEAPLDSTPPTFAGGVSGIAVSDAGTNGVLNISWNTATDGGTPNSPPVTYNLYRSSISAADVWNNLYKSGLGVTSLQDTGLTNGVTYYYGVRARDNASPPNATTNTDTASGVPTRGAVGCDTCHYSPPEDPRNRGSHAAHVSSERIAQFVYTDCEKCHPGASTYPMAHQDGSGQLGFSGTAYMAVYAGNTLTYSNGPTTYYSDTNGYGILTGSTGDNTDSGTCSNTSCHGTATPVWGNPATVTCGQCHNNGTLVTPNAPTVQGLGVSNHTATAKGGPFVSCNNCHTGHRGAVLVPLPPASWNNRDNGGGTTMNMRAQLGIDYTQTGGIHLGGAATTGTTEAGTCWNCHGTDDTVNEWGANIETNGTTFPLTKAWSGDSYNHGLLYSNSGWTTLTPYWVDDTGKGMYRKDAYQHDSSNSFALSKRISSVHSVNFDPSGQSSSVAQNIDGSGNVKRGSTQILETPDQIRCSYCHDVHNLNKAVGDAQSGRPFLRGSWTGNPYGPDLPPLAAYTFPSTGGPQGWGNRFAGSSGTSVKNPPDTPAPVATPRVFPSSSTGTSATMGRGGYFIDQNSGWPTKDANYDTVGKTAGICTLCHGSDVSNMDYYVGSKMWRTDQANGHANSTLGGGGAAHVNARNLFDARRGGTQGIFDLLQDAAPGTIDRWGRNSFDSMRPQQDGPFGPQLGPFPQFADGCPLCVPPVNSGWYGGTEASRTRGGQYATWYSASGIGTDGSTGATRAHSFTCSKCHSPHATGLPALLITNCLDFTTARWAYGSGSGLIGPTSTTTWARRVQNNCHRKESTDTGWHRLAPAQ